MASAEQAGGGANRRRVQDFLLTVALIGGLFAIPRIPVRDSELRRDAGHDSTAHRAADCADHDHHPVAKAPLTKSAKDLRLAVRPTHRD